MNTTILKKCIDSLNSESPDISYIKGMLETLMELNQTPVSIPHYTQPMLPPTTPFNIPSNPYTGGGGTVNLPPEEEGSGLLATYERGPVANIQ